MSTVFCPMCHRETADETTCEHCSASTRLRDRWVLESMLGHGASGYTWRARDLETGDVVAIKELSFRRLTDLKSLELFEREGEALEGIDHPAVPQFLERFVVEDDRFVSAYLVQEFIDGETLSLSARTSESEVRDFLLAVGEILDALHRRRPPIIHRDVKPSNVMRRSDGSYVLIDFGAIRAAAEASMGGSTVAGTLGYMAPEQLLGKAKPASDFYGLGATAIAMLAGRDAHEVLDPHAPGSWRKRTDVSDALGDVIERLVAPRSQDRISTFSELREALDTAAREPAPPDSGTSLLERFRELREASTQRKAPELREEVETSKTANVGSPTAHKPGTTDFALFVIGVFAAVGVGAGFAPLFAATVATMLDNFDSEALATLLGWLLLVTTAALTASYVVAAALREFISPRRSPFGIAAITGSFVATLGLILLLFNAPTQDGWLPSKHAAVSQLWFGEIDGELLIARQLDGGGCAVAVQRVSDGDVVRRIPVPVADGERCNVRYTDNGSAWVQVAPGHFRLFDLGSGELLFDSKTEVQGEARHERFASGEKVLLKLPDGTQREVGVERERVFDREGKFVPTGHWVYSADLPNPPGFRKQVFVRDSACGALMHMHTTEFGEGDWQIAQVGHSAPQWTRTAVELTGQPNIEGVVVGHDLCWLVTRAGSHATFHELDVQSGTAKPVVERLPVK